MCDTLGSDRFSEELLESENDRRIESVANKVSTLKHVSNLLSYWHTQVPFGCIELVTRSFVALQLWD